MWMMIMSETLYPITELFTPAADIVCIDDIAEGIICECKAYVEFGFVYSFFVLWILRGDDVQAFRHLKNKLLFYTLKELIYSEVPATLMGTIDIVDNHRRGKQNDK